MQLCGADIVARREINDFAAALLRTNFRNLRKTSFLCFSYYSYVYFMLNYVNYEIIY